MMRKMMLKRSVLNIRMLAVVVINFAILFGSLIENGVFQAEAGAMRGSYDLLLMYTLPFGGLSMLVPGTVVLC